MLLGELSLDAGPASSSIDKLEGKMGSLEGAGGKIGSVLGELATGPLGAITAAVGTAAGIVEGFKHTLDLGGELNDLSARTGESVGQLTILREAFSEAGLGADGVEPFLLKLQSALGGVNEEGEKTSDAFAALGTSAEELKGLNAIGQIEKLQQGFAGIADQADKIQAARNLFGKSGGQMLSLLGDPQALDDARKHAGPLADLMEKNAGTFDHLGDVLGALKLKFDEFFGGALSKIAPEFTTLAEALDGIDFVGIGESVGTLAKPFLLLGEALGSLAPLINEVGEGLSGIFGSGSTANIGLSEKFRGGAAKILGDMSSSSTGPISSLQKVGLGGGFGGGDPLIVETQRTNQILQRIEAKLSPAAPSQSFKGPPI